MLFLKYSILILIYNNNVFSLIFFENISKVTGNNCSRIITADISILSFIHNGVWLWNIYFNHFFKIWLVINASIWGTCSHIQIHVHQYWFVLVCTFWLMRFSKHIDGMGWLRSVRGTQQRDTISGSNGCRGNVVSWLLLSKSLVFTLWVSSVNHGLHGFILVKNLCI